MKPQEEDRDRAPTIWLIEPGYTTVQFSARKLFFGTVTGQFSALTGTIIFDESDVRRSSVEATLKAASLSAGNRRRDAHLRAHDFLAVEQYPEIHFHSSKVEKGRDRDTLRVSGVLTIKGTSREIVLDVTQVDRSRSPQGDEVAYYSARTEIDRHAFGLNYGRGMIGNRLTVMIHAQALRQQ